MPLNGYAVYLKDNTSGKKIELPVNPAEVKLKYENDDSSETIINLGEVNILGKRKLTELSIKSFFPDPKRHASYLAVKKAKKPSTYISFINSVQKKNHKLRVVVASTKISLLMTVSSFEYGQEGGFADDYTYTLTLKEYRKFGYKKLKNPKGKGKKSGKKKRSSPAKKVSMGSKVKVSARLHRDSYGTGPGMYVKNQKLKVTNIAPGRKYPIHVATLDGTPQGWVKRSEVSKL